MYYKNKLGREDVKLVETKPIDIIVGDVIIMREEGEEDISKKSNNKYNYLKVISIKEDGEGEFRMTAVRVQCDSIVVYNNFSSGVLEECEEVYKVIPKE